MAHLISSDLIDAWVEKQKKTSSSYPESVALGALEVKFEALGWRVGDLLDAIENDPEEVKFYVKGIREFVARMQKEAK